MMTLPLGVVMRKVEWPSHVNLFPRVCNMMACLPPFEFIE